MKQENNLNQRITLEDIKEDLPQSITVYLDNDSIGTINLQKLAAGREEYVFEGPPGAPLEWMCGNENVGASPLAAQKAIERAFSNWEIKKEKEKAKEGGIGR